MANISNIKVKTGNVLSLSGSSVEITGSVSASGDFYLGGILTAREYHTQIVTSSVIYESGSTKFGDDAGDTHQFTGSVNISGTTHSITGALNIVGNVSGTTFTGSFSGNGSGLTNLNLGGSAVTSLNLGANSNLSSSGTTGVVTIALTSSVSGLTNLSSSAITGSDVLVNSSLKAAGAFVVAQVTTTGSYTVTGLDQVIFANAASGPLTVTVPTVSAGNAGRQLVVKKIDATVNTVTVSGSVDGASTYELNGPYQSITLVCDGTTNWFVL